MGKGEGVGEGRPNTASAKASHDALVDAVFGLPPGEDS